MEIFIAGIVIVALTIVVAGIISLIMALISLWQDRKRESVNKDDGDYSMITFDQASNDKYDYLVFSLSDLPIEKQMEIIENDIEIATMPLMYGPLDSQQLGKLDGLSRRRTELREMIVDEKH